MHRTRIEWTDYTWNPITGCSYGCEYCYARKMAYRLKGRYGYPDYRPFRPTFHPERIKEPYQLIKPSRIFVCSMGEIFGFYVVDEWREAVMRVMIDNPRHTFQVLTKVPDMLYHHTHMLGKNVWMGVSVSTLEETWMIDELVSIFQGESCEALPWVSFEPLHEFIPYRLCGVRWVVVGAETGNRKGKIVPKREWIAGIIQEAREYYIPIFLKDNLKPYWDGELIQEFPEVEK